MVRAPVLFGSCDLGAHAFVTRWVQNLDKSSSNIQIPYFVYFMVPNLAIPGVFLSSPAVRLLDNVQVRPHLRARIIRPLTSRRDNHHRSHTVHRAPMLHSPKFDLSETLIWEWQLESQRVGQSDRRGMSMWSLPHCSSIRRHRLPA